MKKKMGVVGKLKIVQMRKIIGSIKAQSSYLAKKKGVGTEN